MIPNREGQHQVAVEKLSVLFQGIMLKSNGFYCLNYLHSLEEKTDFNHK